MARVRVGVAGVRAGPRDRLFRDLDLLEVGEVARLHGAPGAAALRRWRAEAGPEYGFVVVAPQRLWSTMRLDDEARAALAAQVAALGAAAVIYPTTPAVSPDARFRDAIAATLRATPAPARAVWDPRGPWGYGDALAVARDAGAVLAVDPLNLAAPYEPSPPPPPGPFAYFRLPMVSGNRPRFDADRLEALADVCARYTEAFVVFAHPEAWRDARLFRRLLGLAPAPRTVPRAVSDADAAAAADLDADHADHADHDDDDDDDHDADADHDHDADAEVDDDDDDHDPSAD
jgi:uncharacterized protein YecE (DUF72 family)